MIFATLICFIAIYSSANATTTEIVTATIKYGEGKDEWVNCRGKAEYDEDTQKGVLYMDSSDPVNQLPLDVLQIIQTYLQNDTIARRYYLAEPRPVWITMVTEVTKETSLPSKPPVEASVGLQILTDVQGSLVCSMQPDPECWNVEIPYCRHDRSVKLIQTKAELTLLKGLNVVFDCTMTYIEHGGTWMGLKINERAAPPYFMNLKSVTSIFLEEKGTTLESVFRASIGYTQEFTDEYYAEITLQPPTTVVQITTTNPVNPVRLVYGFFNENNTGIMFFHGSRVLVDWKEDRGKFVDVKKDVPWAFTGAKSLHVGTETTEGNLEGLTGIRMPLEGLQQKDLKYGDAVKTFLILPYHAVHQPAIIPN